MSYLLSGYKFETKKDQIGQRKLSFVRIFIKKTYNNSTRPDCRPENLGRPYHLSHLSVRSGTSGEL